MTDAGEVGAATTAWPGAARWSLPGLDVVVATSGSSASNRSMAGPGSGPNNPGDAAVLHLAAESAERRPAVAAPWCGPRPVRAGSEPGVRRPEASTKMAPPARA